MSSQTARRDEEEESGPEEHVNSKKVFEDEHGNPIWFFLHKTITSDWQRHNLMNDIETNGGIVQPDDSDVDTVLVDRACNKDNLQLAYNSHRDPSKRRIWVEHMSFVSRCLREGVVRHRQPEPKGMGGSLRSDNRTSFTHEDDENLARYLAIRIPDVESGGRRGYGVYKDLYGAYSEDPEEYGWVNRHPWQSWRNRYNKNVTRFDDMIDDYVKSEKPERKQAYRLQRKHKGWQWPDESEDEEQSGNPSKRRRVDLPPSAPENRVEIRRSPTRKGKERMVPEENVNEMHREPSPLYENLAGSEPGPSQRAPITIHDRSSRRAHVSPLLHDPEPYTSQVTLVEPSYRTQEPRPPKSAVSDSPSQSRGHNVTRGKTDAEVQQNRSSLSLKETNVSTAPVSSVPGAGTSTKTASTSPQHRLMARKTTRSYRIPPESTVIVPFDPPYRNTRSRSRSMEPSDLHLRPKPRRKKRIDHRGITLPLLEESASENYQPPVEPLEPHTPPAPIGETLEEEWDVEDLLVNISGRSQTTEDELEIRAKDNPSPQSTEDDGANKPRSLDSDDAQTERWLRQPSVQARIPVPPQALDVGPDEMLRRFREASMNAARSSKGPSMRTVPSQARTDPATRFRHSVPLYSQDVFSGVSLPEQQPRTPATKPQSQLWRRSTSSIESFPIAGTKASAAKKNIETEEKHTPYRPPVGTRAALLTKEQHIPRVQKTVLQQ